MSKLIIIGCTNVGRYMIEEMINNNNIKTELVGVVNLNAKVALNKANYDSYSDLKVKYNIDIKYCENVNDKEIIEWVTMKQPDLIIQTGWSQKFLPKLLSIPKFGCIGEHPSPLPKGRGAACVNWAILTGETKWGDTFFKMVEQYDKGCIYSQNFFDIEQFDTVYTIYEKVALASVKSLRDNIDNWANGKFTIIEQDDSKATYYKRRTPTDGEIKNFDWDAKDLNNFIRAQTKPYPCAYFMYNGNKINVVLSRLNNSIPNDEIGIVFKTHNNYGSINVTCGNKTVIEIIRVQPENKPSMWAYDWAIENNIVGKKLL